MRNINDITNLYFLFEGYKPSDTATDSVNPNITYDGFLNEQGEYYIMKTDNSAGSYRYVKGSSNYPVAWANRETLTYDYYNNVFK